MFHRCGSTRFPAASASDTRLPPEIALARVSKTVVFPGNLLRGAVKRIKTWVTTKSGDTGHKLPAIQGVMVHLMRSILIVKLLPNASWSNRSLATPATRCWLAIVFCVAASWSTGTWADDPPCRSIFEIQETSSAGDSDTSPSVPSPPSALLLERAIHPLMRRDLAIGGAVSCAAAGCHGGSRPGLTERTAERGSEYPLWYENDPHARSWRTICSPQSVAIMQRLRITDGTTIRDRAGFDNCLACHNTAGHYDDARVSSPLREGVGCAACHGPDAAWIDRHYRRDWHPSFESANGFVAAGDLFVRARMCASCHVGDADRDMNHDMIAAGHPPLRYEFATYHRRLPKHWRDAAACDVSRFEAQLWLAGQVAALDASLTLLESRAGKSRSVNVWPELAEYDCASCHHQLKIGDIDKTESRSRPRGWRGAQAGIAQGSSCFLMTSSGQVKRASRTQDSVKRFVASKRSWNRTTGPIPPPPPLRPVSRDKRWMNGFVSKAPGNDPNLTPTGLSSWRSEGAGRQPRHATGSRPSSSIWSPWPVEPLGPKGRSRGSACASCGAL